AKTTIRGKAKFSAYAASESGSNSWKEHTANQIKQAVLHTLVPVPRRTERRVGMCAKWHACIVI
ncbi:MAG: hypothetical protein RR650_01355, partial [Comamonas sp.]